MSRVAWFSGFLVVVLTALNSHAVRAQDGWQLLKTYSQYFDNIGAYRLRMEIATTKVDGDSQPAKPSVQTALLSRHGDMLFLELGSFEQRSASVTQRIFDGERYLELQFSRNNDGEYDLKTVASALKYPKDHLRIQIDFGLWNYLFARFPESMRLKEIKAGNFFEVLSLPRAGRKRDSTETQVRWFDGKTNVELEFDPQRAFPVTHVKVSRENPKPGVRDFVSETFSVGDYANFSGMQFPSSFSVEQHLSEGVFEGAGRDAKVMEATTMTSEVKILMVDVAPDGQEQDFRLSHEIPNDFPVHMIDSPNLSYKWANGRVVPASDAEAMESIRRFALNQSPPIQSRKGIYYFASIAVFAAALLGALFLALKSKGSK